MPNRFSHMSDDLGSRLQVAVNDSSAMQVLKSEDQIVIIEDRL